MMKIRLFSECPGFEDVKKEILLLGYRAARLEPEDVNVFLDGVYALEAYTEKAARWLEANITDTSLVALFPLEPEHRYVWANMLPDWVDATTLMKELEAYV